MICPVCLEQDLVYISLYYRCRKKLKLNVGNSTYHYQNWEDGNYIVIIIPPYRLFIVPTETIIAMPNDKFKMIKVSYSIPIQSENKMLAQIELILTFS
jgi:hypothetical protein